MTKRTKTLAVTAAIFRLIVGRARGADHFQWTPNDAEDLTHAIIGLAHADVVVLDGKWANRVRGLTRAAVFSCAEMPKFMDWCERYSQMGN